MTHKEIMDKMNELKKELEVLGNELHSETDKDRRMEIMDRMMEITNEAYDLDTMNKNRILKELEEQTNLFITKIKNIFK